MPVSKHFQNLKIINFDMISSKGKLSESKMKKYQTANHREILSYPPELQDETMSSIFRTKRDDIYLLRKKL